MGGLSHGEQKVGVIWGFMRQILSIANRLNSNKFLFCWDSRNRKRTEIYPQYKANRHKEKTDEEIELDDMAYAQFSELRSTILPKMGFKNNFRELGYEADDIIAKIVNDNGSKFVIVSTDQDLFQLLSPRSSMLISNDKPLYTEEAFRRNYNIDPSQWIDVKSISGCSGDNVKGVKGVGDITAIKYLKNELSVASKAFQSIQRDKELIALNRRLVELPFEGLRSFTIVDDRLSLDGFMDICNKYNFQSFLSKDSLSEWKKWVFNG